MRKIKFAPGNIYHIYNRGVEKRNIFTSDSDRWRFLQGLFLFNDENIAANLLFRLEREKKVLNFKILREYLNQENNARKPLVRIILDCLQSNHFHLALEEILPGGISRFMHRLGVGYTKYFNTRHDRIGHLFQGRFQAVPIKDDIQFKYLFAYINVINPIKEMGYQIEKQNIKNVEEIMQILENYPWSTHQEYLGKRESIIIDKGIGGEIFSSPKEYEEFVRQILLGKINLDPIKNLTLE